jgi:hypothetical protein
MSNQPTWASRKSRILVVVGQLLARQYHLVRALLVELAQSELGVSLTHCFVATSSTWSCAGLDWREAISSWTN